MKWGWYSQRDEIGGYANECYSTGRKIARMYGFMVQNLQIASGKEPFDFLGCWLTGDNISYEIWKAEKLANPQKTEYFRMEPFRWIAATSLTENLLELVLHNSLLSQATKKRLSQRRHCAVWLKAAFSCTSYLKR